MSNLPKIQHLQNNPIWTDAWQIIERQNYKSEITDDEKRTLKIALPVIKQMLVPATKKESLTIYNRTFCGANPGWIPHAEKGFPLAKNEWLDSFSRYPFWVNLMVYKEFMNRETYASLPKYHELVTTLTLYQNLLVAKNVILSKINCK